MSLFQPARRRFADLSVAHKLAVLCGTMALGIVLLSTAAARLQFQELTEARKLSVRTQVDAGMSLIEHYAAQARDGTLTRPQAQARAIEALAAVRTNAGTDYFFIADPQLRIVMHPNRAPGDDMRDYTSAAGEYVYRDILDAVRRGDGYSTYRAPRPGVEGQFPKISYARAYPDWDWILSMGVYADDIREDAMGFTWRMVALGALLLGAVAGLAWWIGRAIVGPLRTATRTAEAIAGGRFDTPIRVDADDETGHLMASMQQMQEQLRRFNTEMQTMIALQQGEDIGHRMPEDFPGDYGTLARGVNTVVFEHLDAIADAMAVMDAYGRGDLRADMRRLPGQRARLHEALDAVKANLSAIQREIAQLAEAAAQGDFAARGDRDRYRFAFAEMVDALNRLMAQADTGLSDVGRIVGAIADGDLSQRTDGQYRGAFEALATATDRTAARLAGIVRGIQDAARAIDTAAGEIAAGNTDLSRRTEGQAANLEETAASMEELTSTVRQNAEHARQANRLAHETGGIAAEGGRAMEQVATTMGAIQAASSRIGDIIGVIDGIAFQTNLLALNAAVEAARAGEQGRGFAVVAGEVRALAQRSAAAAGEVRTLIDDSVQRVRQGADQVVAAGETMAGIVEAVRQVTGITAEISAASQEQTQGIEQVNQAIAQIDTSTQQNAALVEEAGAATRSLADQARALTRAVDAFRLDGTPTNATAGATA